MEEKQEVQKVSRRQWWKNVGSSLNELWKGLANQYPGCRFINGVFVTAKEVKKKKLENKGVPVDKVNKLSLKQALSFKNFLVKTIGKDKIEMAKDAKNHVKKALSTGQFINKGFFTQDMFGDMDGFDDDDMFLATADAMDDAFGESVKGGYMIKYNLDMNIIRLKGYASGESLNAISNMSNINKIIEETTEEIITTVAGFEHYNPYLKSDKMVIKNKTQELKNKIYSIAKGLRMSKQGVSLYAESLATSVVVLDEAQSHFCCNIPTEENIDDALVNIKNTDRELGSIDDNLSAEYRDKIQDTVDDLSDTKDSLVFDPIDEDDLDELVPAGENMFLNIAVGLGKILYPVAAMIGNIDKVLPIFSTLGTWYYNLFSKRKSTDNVVYQPLLVSKRISASNVKELSKALEVEQAMNIKMALEEIRARFNKGSIENRMNKLEIGTRNNLAKGRDDEYNRILGKFSESLIKFYGKNPDLYDLATCRNYLVGRGEQGHIMQTGRSGLPTYLEVNLTYLDYNSKKNGDNSTRSMIGVSVTPRSVTGEEIVDVIKFNSFKEIAITAKERSSYDNTINILSIFSKNKENDDIITPAAKHKISQAINDLKKVKVPFFHVMLEFRDYLDLKKAGVDILDDKHYTAIMSSLPILTISIVNEDEGTILVSSSKIKRFVRKDIKDLVSHTDQLEKQLRTNIRLQNSL